ncbi:hypothetical protein NE237_012142 [Protea cynaroides]|uniref:LOB domain-containing protein n=1 Tax=Protea cynaroides TaxID=273540 RepID=A0A9Q0H1A3_9MAGN|nr:hypothetical protein NE237_012142 [Protea cynaroides]
MTSLNSSSSSSGGSGGGVGGSGGGSGGSGGTGPCGACKFLRRKCVAGCIFAPYFDTEQGATNFAAVHKVFGASNVSKLLMHLPVHKRLDAVITICFEAQSRIRDPVYGCVGHIVNLHQQLVNLQAELSYLQAQLATLQLPSPTPLLPPPTLLTPPSHSVPNLPARPSMQAGSFDLSTLFDPQVQPTPWTLQEQLMELRQYSGGGGGDLQALARELLQRHGSSMGPSHPAGPSSAPPIPPPPPPPPPFPR